MIHRGVRLQPDNRLTRSFRLKAEAIASAAVLVIVFAANPPEGGYYMVAANPPEGGHYMVAAAQPPTGRVGAPVDLTGTWVSVVTEDWEARMTPPVKGDYTTIEQVMNAQARKVADAWEPSMDGRCEAYGVGGVMRLPGRLRISWQDDTTLKIETDGGAQTRLLRFIPAPAPAGPRTLQGYSIAEWQRGGGQQDAFLGRGVGSAGSTQRWGGLKVTTTHMLAGWLRPNGVPYSESSTVTEHFTRFTHPVAGDWFVVTTVVVDPQYLTQPFITSTNFKREANDAKFKPVPCKT